MQSIKYSEIPEGFAGFLFAPSNEYEVVMLFSMVLPYLKPPMSIKEASDIFPDCTVIRWDTDGPKEMTVEIEKNASDFLAHNHDISQCNIIVCWENDWDDCSIEIIELKREVRNLPRQMVLKPTEYLHVPTKGNFESYFRAVDEKCSEATRKEQKKLYDCLKPLGLFANFGTGKEKTYTIRSGHYSLGIVRADGYIELYFLSPEYTKNPLPDQVRETYRREAEKNLNIDTEGKPWKKVGKLGTSVSFDKLKQVLEWIAREIGQI